ncbi:hypothetical protein CBR_g21243 [Chara braunii]|uniref:RNA helicase n=1 Tax=Chara braunii TaxID=69332 RepID=A0A388L196_CHABU|nr:hypothetical protein CBR_g21243 [Chara braunii]|eukprot:GBG76002.1 hypothetical protein CBR_g21243 [Chara braunii]
MPAVRHSHVAARMLSLKLIRTACAVQTKGRVFISSSATATNLSRKAGQHGVKCYLRPQDGVPHSSLARSPRCTHCSRATGGMWNYDLRGLGGSFRNASLHSHVGLPLLGENTDHHRYRHCHRHATVASPHLLGDRRVCLALVANGLVVDTAPDGEKGTEQTSISTGGRNGSAGGSDPPGGKEGDGLGAMRTRELFLGSGGNRRNQSSVLTTSDTTRASDDGRSGRANGNVSPFASTGFEDLKLSPRLAARLQEIGVTRPTDVQVGAIPVLMEGRDAAVQSYTGSGKTLAYLLPLLTRVGPLKAEMERAIPDELGGESAPGNRKQLQAKRAEAGEGKIEAVIVAPSRELGMQIVREIERIVGNEQRHVVQQLIGGASLWRQEEGLKKHKPAIVVGTPGRLADLSRSGRLQTHACKMLVLDEAEELLSPNFKPDMLRILEHVGRRRGISSSAPSSAVRGASALEMEKKSRKSERQLVLVSATMPPSVIAAAGRWGDEAVVVRASMNATEVQPWEKAMTKNGRQHDKGSNRGPADAREGAIGSEESDREVVVPPNIAHWVVVTDGRHKVDAVRRTIHALEAQKVLVFMNFGRRLKDARFKLASRGLTVGCLHGDMGKVERANVLAGFRDGSLRVLLVSDVAARGLDIADCDLVVNLELPTDASHYGHRAGRTGRIGKKGCVVSVCEERESFVVEKFAKRLGITMTRGDVKEGFLVESEAVERRGGEKEDEPQEQRVRARGRPSRIVPAVGLRKKESPLLRNKNV